MYRSCQLLYTWRKARWKIDCKLIRLHIDSIKLDIKLKTGFIKFAALFKLKSILIKVNMKN